MVLSLSLSFVVKPALLFEPAERAKHAHARSSPGLNGGGRPGQNESVRNSIIVPHLSVLVPIRCHSRPAQVPSAAHVPVAETLVHDQIQASSTEFGPLLTESRPIWANLDQLWPNLGPTLMNFGRSWPKFGMAEFRSKFDISQTSAQLGQNGLGFGQTWSALVEFRHW